MYEGQNQIRDAGLRAYALGDEKRKYDDAAMQAKMQAAACGQSNLARDQSPIDQALEHLAKMVEIASLEAAELHGRLQPVSRTGAPSEDAKNGGVLAGGSICKIEERINDLSARIASLGRRMSVMRESLCI